MFYAYSICTSMHKMSGEQQAVANHIRNGFNVTVDACAGSGKSTTILSIAKELPLKKIQQFTYNSMLRHEIKEKVRELQIDNLQVHTFHSFAVKYYASNAYTDTGIRQALLEKQEPRHPIPLFDIVVLDESQDMTMLYFELIVKMARDMCQSTDHRFQLLVLGDYMQGLYEFKGADIRFLTRSADIWTSLPYLCCPEFKACDLKTSYRITNQMASFVNHDMLGKTRLVACREGGPVTYVRRPKTQIENIVVYQIRRLLNEGESPSDIFVLGSSVKGPNSPIRNMENVLTEADIPCHVPMMESDIMDERVIEGKVVFSTFHTVKGRQRKYVFVIGFDQSYFFNARNLSQDVCPNTLYVACTRATHGLYVLQKDSSQPLEFLCRDQYAMKQSEYIDFKGIPQMIFYQPSPQEEEGVVTIPTFHVTPTELIKFLSEKVIDFVTPILDKVFIQESEHTEADEFDIPRIIRTSNGLYEEVSDLNGIALPAMYYDEIQGHHRDGEQVLKTMIQTIMQEVKEYRHLYLKRVIQTLPETCSTPSDYLFLANVFAATQERLYSKVKQISQEEHTWITPEMKEKCMKRLHDNLGHEFIRDEEGASVVTKKNDIEHQVIHYSHDKQHELIDACLLPFFQNEKIFRFSGRLDILSETTIWELKCTSKITLEHKLQVIVYAWLWNIVHPQEPRKVVLFNVRTNERLRLECSTQLMTDIVVTLLRNKYSEPEVIDDAAFFSMCETIQDTYLYDDLDEDDSTE